MSKIILINKPFQVLSQFTDDHQRRTLKDILPDQPGFYPAGRLDYDSEGLLLLTDDGRLQQRISDPQFKLAKTYWVQVEGHIDDKALAALRSGIRLKDGLTLPARVERIAEPAIWPRDPPVRQRANIPTSWISLTISEGRNRQVRRMTAAAGYPTLRLVRAAIGHWQLGGLQPGQYRKDTVHLPQAGRKGRKS
ncbi:MAG TPA: pseudouridine synthase [Pseudomonadales bacterium]